MLKQIRRNAKVETWHVYINDFLFELLISAFFVSFFFEIIYFFFFARRLSELFCVFWATLTSSMNSFFDDLNFEIWELNFSTQWQFSFDSLMLRTFFIAMYKNLDVLSMIDFRSLVEQSDSTEQFSEFSYFLCLCDWIMCNDADQSRKNDLQRFKSETNKRLSNLDSDSNEQISIYASNDVIKRISQILIRKLWESRINHVLAICDNRWESR